MILIWRGLGFLSILLVLVGLLIGVGIGTQFEGGSMVASGAGVGLLLGGAGGAALGWWLNIVRPEAEITRARDGLRQELWARVQAGQFQMAPGAPAPQSEQDAHQQVDAVVASQEKQFSKYRNRHTVFWIPMHWVSAGLAVLGLVVLVAGTISLVTSV